MSVKLARIRTMDDILELTCGFGFLPYFRNELEGFSIEDACPDMWSMPEGPWEWKGPLIRTGRVVYGKLFRGKAGYASLDIFPELANYRRDGYDFDSLYEDGKARFKDKSVYDAIVSAGSAHTDEIKAALGYSKDGLKGFDTVMTRLQMQTYVIAEDFEYRTDKRGKQYGWGIARWSAPERAYGADLVRSAYHREPAESFELIVEHLAKALGTGDRKTIEKLLK